MKRILLLMITSIAFAKGNYIDNHIIEYQKNHGNMKHISRTLNKKDKNLQQALKLMHDESLMESKSVLIGSPESGDKATKKIQIPKWNKILKQLYTSVTERKNHLSAYLGLNIIKTYFSKQSKMKEYVTFLKILYSKETMMCDIVYDFGEMHERGFYTKVDKKKALSIYQYGSTLKTCNSWQKNVIDSRIFKLSKDLKKQ